MREILIRLTALCMAAAVGHQLTADSRLQEGIRLLCGLLTAELILEAAHVLPQALF